MNKLSLAKSPVAPSVRLFRDTRGASMVEYALLLTLVVVAVSPGLRSVGEHVNHAFLGTIAVFAP